MPSRKVTMGTMAGAATIVLIWVIQQSTHLVVPGDVAAALTTLLTFVTAYMMPDKSMK